MIFRTKMFQLKIIINEFTTFYLDWFDKWIPNTPLNIYDGHLWLQCTNLIQVTKPSGSHWNILISDVFKIIDYKRSIIYNAIYIKLLPDGIFSFLIVSTYHIINATNNHKALQEFKRFLKRLLIPRYRLVTFWNTLILELLDPTMDLFLIIMIIYWSSWLSDSLVANLERQIHPYSLMCVTCGTHMWHTTLFRSMCVTCVSDSLVANLERQIHPYSLNFHTVNRSWRMFLWQVKRSKNKNINIMGSLVNLLNTFIKFISWSELIFSTKHAAWVHKLWPLKFLGFKV